MTPTWLEEMKRAAESATPGPWSYGPMKRRSSGYWIGADTARIGVLDMGIQGDVNSKLVSSCSPERIQALIAVVEALEKIADPRKRDHKEPDTYTELGCVMNIANDALERLEKVS